jgi:hypothetical protein
MWNLLDPYYACGERTDDVSADLNVVNNPRFELMSPVAVKCRCLAAQLLSYSCVSGKSRISKSCLRLRSLD